MTFELIVFLLFVFTTFYDNAIQWYTHMQSYPLQAYVGQNEYAAYGKFYEGRLVYALYIPYVLLLVSNVILFFARPAGIEIGWLIAAFLLNLSILFISVFLAVPQHREHAREGRVTQEGVAALLRVNLLRLGAASLSSLIVLFLLGRLLVA